MLGVRYVAHGAVQTAGRQIRVHAALTDADDRRRRSGRSSSTGRATISSPCRARSPTPSPREVETQIEFLERGRSLLKPSENLDAWEAYHRGCWHMFKFRPEHYEEAERYFLRSIELDPTSPRPFAGLSFVHWQRAFLEISPDRAGEIAQARELAEEAIALDPRDPQGYNALGRAHHPGRRFRRRRSASCRRPSISIRASRSGNIRSAFALQFAGLIEESQDVVTTGAAAQPVRSDALRDDGAEGEEPHRPRRERRGA